MLSQMGISGLILANILLENDASILPVLSYMLRKITSKERFSLDLLFSNSW